RPLTGPSMHQLVHAPTRPVTLESAPQPEESLRVEGRLCGPRDSFSGRGARDAAPGQRQPERPRRRRRRARRARLAALAEPDPPRASAGAAPFSTCSFGVVVGAGSGAGTFWGAGAFGGG